MNESYSKNYFEKYAALTLCKILAIDAGQIEILDRPDLRIASLDYGIEVTQALTPQEAVADIKKPLYGILKINPFDHSQKDLSFVIKKIDHAIVRKEKKALKYQSYLHNGLYIFSHCHNLPLEMLQQYFNTHPLTTSFYSYIYINCVSHIFIYDCLNNSFKQVNYQKKELFAMNDEALEFEKNCSKKRRKIIIKAS